MKNLNVPQPQCSGTSDSRFATAMALAFSLPLADPELVAWHDRSTPLYLPYLKVVPVPMGGTTTGYLATANLKWMSAAWIACPMTTGPAR